MGGCVGRYWQGWEDTQSRGSRNGGRGGRNEPLKKDRPKWKSDYPMTEGQLRSKRDEFWDTAPAFEGRKEIWDALKAAAVALEFNDHELAQAIVDGASITLPHGKDRKLNKITKPPSSRARYRIQYFVGTDHISSIVSKSASSFTSPYHGITSETYHLSHQEFQLKVRLSTGTDLRLSASMGDTIGLLKKQLQAQEDIDGAHQRWFFSGKLLTDKTRLQDTKIQKDFVIQVIVNPQALRAPKLSTTASSPAPELPEDPEDR
ncbi:ubiquitin domain-containing protein 1 [Perca fluviatilis]|uniref:ubiquitin domain-containing protein 1 n=1 Tax=Perca fluviatilis TaxID=8168 RepID=UPI001965D4EC|nr:ubiquitin domain-containing protein 1 [Perca fluviatilis]